MLETKIAASVLLPYFVAFISALSLPWQLLRNTTAATSASTLNGNRFVYPKDPPGFAIDIHADTSIPLKEEDVYVAAIDVVYDWADDGWDPMPVDTGKLNRDFEGVSVSFRSVALPGTVTETRFKYLILGMLHLIKSLTNSKRFVSSIAILYSRNKPIGYVELNKPASAGARNFASNSTELMDTMATKAPHQKLTSTRRIIDPDDHDLVITYERNGAALPCVDLLSTALYAIATAAQDSTDEYCDIFCGLNPSQSVQWNIFGVRPTISGYLLFYSTVKTGFKLLPVKLYKENACGEVKFKFEYKGDVLGRGSIHESDLSKAARV